MARLSRPLCARARAPMQIAGPHDPPAGPLSPVTVLPTSISHLRNREIDVARNTRGSSKETPAKNLRQRSGDCRRSIYQRALRGSTDNDRYSFDILVKIDDQDLYLYFSQPAIT